MQGEDPVRAEEALLAFATTLGRMHAATVGREAEYRSLRSALGAGAEADRAWMGDSLSALREGTDAIGLQLPTGFDSEMETVQAAMENPGPFLAYTHGDPCPDNDRLLNGRLRLFDYEFGAFRHALLDGVYGRVPFPTCWCVNRLPPYIPARMEAAYRTELVQGCPEAADDAQFYRGVVMACAHWIIRTTGWLLPIALKEDRTWGISTLRQRVLMRLDAFEKTAAEFDALPTLGATAGALAARLRALWPPEADEMPLYPAFRKAE